MEIKKVNRTQINIGIIGCGEMGEAHAAALSRLEHADIRTFCDIDASRALRLQELHPSSGTTTDPEEVFRDDGIDAVYICTRTDTHAALAERAARCGKHIMMEKPLALTAGECYRVCEVVEQTGIIFMTAFKFRFYPAVSLARQQMPRPTLSIAQLCDRRWPDDFWGNDPIRGGGNVLSQGCHMVDLLHHLHHAEPRRIYAEGGNIHHRSLPIIDTIAATLTFADGSMSSLTIGDSGLPPLVSKFSLQLMDGTGSLHLYNRMRSLIADDGTSVTEHHDADEHGAVEENRAFLNAVRHGAQPPTDAVDGLRATIVILKAFESIKTGKPQEIRL